MTDEEYQQIADLEKQIQSLQARLGRAQEFETKLEDLRARIKWWSHMMAYTAPEDMDFRLASMFKELRSK